EAEELDVEAEGDDSDGQVPDGAAVFPIIPPELGVNPLLLAVVHALVFLAGSDEDVVAPPAADEAVQSMANYLQRLEGPALAKVLANALVRAGVGHLRLVDRDFIETNNLQRQVLFDEHDVAENLPKAEAGARKLAAINSSVHVEPVVTDIDRTNILDLVHDA